MKFYQLLNETRDVPVQELLRRSPSIVHDVKTYAGIRGMMDDPAWDGRSQEQQEVLKRKYMDAERRVNQFLNSTGYRYGEIRDYIDYLDTEDLMVPGNDMDRHRIFMRNAGQRIMDSVSAVVPGIDLDVYRASQLLSIPNDAWHATSGEDEYIISWHMMFLHCYVAIRGGMEYADAEAMFDAKIRPHVKQALERMGCRFWSDSRFVVPK